MTNDEFNSLQGQCCTFSQVWFAFAHYFVKLTAASDQHQTFVGSLVCDGGITKEDDKEEKNTSLLDRIRNKSLFPFPDFLGHDTNSRATTTDVCSLGVSAVYMFYLC